MHSEAGQLNIYFGYFLLERPDLQVNKGKRIRGRVGLDRALKIYQSTVPQRFKCSDIFFFKHVGAAVKTHTLAAAMDFEVRPEFYSPLSHFSAICLGTYHSASSSV